ncbi:hypothetical protein EJB05_13765, partial [Eragrostis curvula]
MPAFSKQPATSSTSSVSSLFARAASAVIRAEIPLRLCPHAPHPHPPRTSRPDLLALPPHPPAAASSLPGVSPPCSSQPRSGQRRRPPERVDLPLALLPVVQSRACASRPECHRNRPPSPSQLCRPAAPSSLSALLTAGTRAAIREVSSPCSKSTAGKHLKELCSLILSRRWIRRLLWSIAFENTLLHLTAVCRMGCCPAMMETFPRILVPVLLDLCVDACLFALMHCLNQLSTRWRSFSLSCEGYLQACVSFALETSRMKLDCTSADDMLDRVLAGCVDDFLMDFKSHFLNQLLTCGLLCFAGIHIPMENTQPLCEVIPQLIVNLDVSVTL